MVLDSLGQYGIVLPQCCTMRDTIVFYFVRHHGFHCMRHHHGEAPYETPDYSILCESIVSHMVQHINTVIKYCDCLVQCVVTGWCTGVAYVLHNCAG